MEILLATGFVEDEEAISDKVPSKNDKGTHQGANICSDMWSEGVREETIGPEGHGHIYKEADKRNNKKAKQFPRIWLLRVRKDPILV
jgi:hypothetical protein